MLAKRESHASERGSDLGGGDDNDYHYQLQAFPHCQSPHSRQPEAKLVTSGQIGVADSFSKGKKLGVANDNDSHYHAG